MSKTDIAKKLIDQRDSIEADLSSAVDSYKTKDFETASKALGDILKVMFIDSSINELMTTNVEIDTSDAEKLFVGLADGISGKVLDNDITDCMQYTDKSLSDVQDAINVIKTEGVSMSSLYEVYDDLVNASKDLRDGLSQCEQTDAVTELSQDLETMATNYSTMTETELLLKLMENESDLSSDLSNVKTDYESGDYQDAGKNLGDILRMLLIN